MTTWVPHQKHALRQDTAMEAILKRVVLELECLVDVETYDEKNQPLDVLETGKRIAWDNMDRAEKWDDAMCQAVYALKEGELLDLLRDGDDCALGKVLREATIKEFAADVFSAAEEECGL